MTSATTTVELEQAAEESDRDRRDHRQLAGDVAELLQHEDAMRIPVAVRRLIDSGVDPMVIAKTLAIGDREGGLWYRMSTRASVTALATHERVAAEWIGLAVRDTDPDTAADVLVSGATWIATQFGIDRDLLVQLVTSAPRRESRIDRRGYGAVDIVDHHGVGDRGSIATAIRNARLPYFAPLVGSPFEVPR